MKKKVTWGLGIGIILIAANLRMPITMMPPLLPWLHSVLGFSTSFGGLLTTIPLVMFALLSPLIARWGIRFGNAQVLWFTLLILTIGAYTRALPNSWLLILGTVLVGIGISGGNVLLPAVIQEYFPQKATLLTGLYTFTMGLIASIGTGLSAPLVRLTGLAGAIVIFAFITLLAFLVWWFVLKQLPKRRLQKNGSKKEKQSISGYGLTWLITLFFGLQSLLYYSMLTWLPVFWQSTGFSTNEASVLATIYQLCGMPMSLLIPKLAEKKSGMFVSSLIVGGGFALSNFGLLLTVHQFALNIILAIVGGLAAGSAFSLCVVFFQKKASSVQQTAQLSGTAQATGYILAAIGPTLTGLIEGKLHSFNLIFIVYGILGILLVICGFLITRHKPLPNMAS